MEPLHLALRLGIAHAGEIAANALLDQPHHQLGPAISRTCIPPRHVVVHQQCVRHRCCGRRLPAARAPPRCASCRSVPARPDSGCDRSSTGNGPIAALEPFCPFGLLPLEPTRSLPAAFLIQHRIMSNQHAVHRDYRQHQAFPLQQYCPVGRDFGRGAIRPETEDQEHSDCQKEKKTNGRKMFTSFISSLSCMRR